MKKRALFALIGVAIGTWGCSFSAGTIGTPTPTQLVDGAGTIVAATMQAYTATPTQSVSTPASTEAATTEPALPVGGASISYEGVSFVIPNGVAANANAEKITAVEANSGAPWEIAPTHLRFTLTEYQVQGKLHEPRIYVYPAEEYAQSNSGAAEQINRLKNILAGATALQETLPIVPFFNATPQIAANIKLIPFQSGAGVRWLTQYAQYAAPINNHELFYHFQGLTGDGKYYMIGVLPVTVSILPEDENPAATIPEGGVPIPTDVGPNDVYYFSVTEKLNSVSPDAFTPSLAALDALVQSIAITTP
jgi:hypothetical protein